MHQTCFWTKLIFGPENFSWILPQLVNRHCCRLSLHAISSKVNEPNLRKWQKNIVLGPIWVLKFLHAFNLYCKLGIVASYHCKQFQAKLIN